MAGGNTTDHNLRTAKIPRNGKSMAKAKTGVPKGYQAVMPYLRVRDAVAAIRFYKKVFGATESFRLKMGGKIGHAELAIGGATIMLSEEFPEMRIVGPKTLKGTTVQLMTYVDDVDKVMAKAVRAGGKVRMAAADQFYGDRSGQIEDPFGHIWSIQTRIEMVSHKDMQKRLNASMRAAAAAKLARKPAKRKSAAKSTRAAATSATAATKPTRKPGPSSKSASASKPVTARQTVSAGKSVPAKKAARRSAKSS